MIPVAIAALEQLGIDSISAPASEMLRMIFAAIPNIIAAAVLLGIGYLISRFVVQIVKEILPGLGVDRAMAESGLVTEGTTVSGIIARVAQVAIILFTAAYVAEVVRGGLQGMGKGQYEAADALGLNYVQTMRLIILPQALKIVIPPTVSVLVSAFKDTSLVVIIALYDFLLTSKTVIQNPEWMGFSTEMYLFVALMYFLGCFNRVNYHFFWKCHFTCNKTLTINRTGSFAQ